VYSEILSSSRSTRAPMTSRDTPCLGTAGYSTTRRAVQRRRRGAGDRAGVGHRALFRELRAASSLREPCDWPPGRRSSGSSISTIYSISREPQRMVRRARSFLERKRTRPRPDREIVGTIRRGQDSPAHMKGHGDILGGASLLSARCGGLCRLKPVRAPRPALVSR